MSIRSFASLFLLSTTALLAGCGDDASPPGSLGQLQNLRFDLEAPVACADCGPDAEIPVGEVVDVDVYNLGRKTRFQVRSTNPVVAEFRATPRCIYLDQASCHEVVTAQGHAPGSADLEIYDDWTGTVLDRYTVKVVDLTSLELKSKH